MDLDATLSDALQRLEFDAGYIAHIEEDGRVRLCSVIGDAPVQATLVTRVAKGRRILSVAGGVSANFGHLLAAPIGDDTDRGALVLVSKQQRAPGPAEIETLTQIALSAATALRGHNLSVASHRRSWRRSK